MKMSSRWCVVACLAVAALGCSDPVGPAKQGAFNARITAASPVPEGKRCPNTATPYFEVPAVPTNTTRDERLDGDTYLHWAVDGEGASVSCTVKGQATSFEGRISSGSSKLLEISSGTLDATLKGTARIRLTNGAAISGSLSSPAADCVINASNSGGTRYEVAPGRIWASFSCKSVEQQPSDYCAASGTFVLENCDQ